MTIQEIMDAVKELKVLELAELVKALEEEFGVSAMPVAVAGGAAAGRRRCVKPCVFQRADVSGYRRGSSRSGGREGDKGGGAFPLCHGERGVRL